MKTNLFKKLDSDKGSVFIISYLVIVLLLGLGAAFLALSTNESRTSSRQRLNTIAFHIAEAGIERALYDLRQDFVNDLDSPSWADGEINGYDIGPDNDAFYDLPYNDTGLNNGSYAVQLKNVSNGDIWVQSTGTVNDVSHTLEVYVRMTNVSPWGNAIFAGSGASGTMINGNVDIRGSVHILGSGLNPGDYAIDIGGTAELVGNNYNGLSSSLEAKVPALPTTIYNGETVETLNAKLRVKKGLVGLSGSATVGEADIAGNAEKETVDGVYVTDGFGGNQGIGSVHSDNGTTNGYDLGNSVAFPSLSDPYPGYTNYQDYLHSNALVLTNELTSLTPGSSFSYSNANGSISMDGNGNLSISGIVYVDGNNNLSMNKSGNDTTITYSGTGALLVTGSVQINTSLVTSGNNSFPTNVIGIMTPNNIGFNGAQIDVMGLFYAEGSVIAEKQTDIMGTIVSNYFDMGTNVPAIYQVPDTANNLPMGMIGGEGVTWYMVVAWLKL